MTTGAAPTAVSLPAFFERHHYETIDSTNDEAKRRARIGAPEGTLITARTQSGGRGRRGRVWQSPDGNLYCSLILRPYCPLARAAQLSFVAAVALANTLANWLPTQRIGLKWPNDVLVDGAKISGILLESEAGTGGVCAWVVVGIGVNIARGPENIDQAAMALDAAAAKSAAPDEVLAALGPALEGWYRRWAKEGFEPVRSAWTVYAAFLSKPVSVRLPDGDVGGMFEGLDAEGAMVLRLADGSRKHVAVGEPVPG